MIDASEFEKPAKPATKGRIVHGRVSAHPDAAERAKKMAALEIRSDKAARSIDYWAGRVRAELDRLQKAQDKLASIRAEIEALK